MDPDVLELANRLDQFQAREGKARRNFGIGLSRKCHVACRHCINDSLPKRHQQLTSAQIRKTCKELAATGEFDSVNLTGGEPFEVYELLYEATAIVSSYGFLPTVVTSASWASDPKTTRDLLLPLSARKLHALIVSRDEFHEPRVPASNVANALLEAIALGMTTAMNLTTGAGIKGRDELIAPIIALMGEEAFGRVHVKEQELLRAGRAERLKPAKFGPADATAPHPLACNVAGPVLLEDGEFTACCGITLPPASPLRLGHCDKTNAAEMLRNVRSDSLVQMIRYLGLRRMAELLGAEALGSQLTNFVSSARPSDLCVVCVRLLSDPDRVAKLRQLAEDPTVQREMAVRAALLYGDIELLAATEV